MNRRELAPATSSIVAHGYRADIDGLRAVAVLAVVLFHAFPGLVPGGFVGVDIFFVISGYLITGIIAREIDAGTYSTWRFYERRLRRIVPAFLVVCAVSAIGAALLYVPNDFELFGESLVASLLIYANIFFFKESGYFAASDEVLPLLHIWSLSVEEQFYVFFPLALVLLSKWKLRTAGIVIGLAVSFAAGCVAVITNPEAAFFLAQYRAWELLIGSFLAVGTLPTLSHRAADVCSLIGGALIAAALWGLSSASTFPGWNAAIPSLGAALLIYAGPQATLNRGLSTAPMVGIGLISYSLYLWHWPLLSFGAYIAIRPLLPIEAAAIVALAFVAAWLSYRFVERPFRRPVNRTGITPLFGGFAALLAVALVADQSKGAAWRLPDDVAAMTNKEAVRSGMPSERCSMRKLAEADQRLAHLANVRRSMICRLGDPNVQPTVILWGDSHGEAAAPALDAALARGGKAGYLFGRGGCVPIVSIERIDRPAWPCAEFADKALQALATIKPELVIMVARWPYYFEGSRYERKGPAPVFAPEGNFEVVAAGLDATLARLRPMVPSLILMTTVPEVGFPVPSTLGRAAILGREIDIAPTRKAYDQRQQRSTAEVTRLAKKYGALLMTPDTILCPGLKCEVVRDGVVLYADYNHLTRAGAHLLVPMFEQAIERR